MSCGESVPQGDQRQRQRAMQAAALGRQQSKTVGSPSSASLRCLLCSAGGQGARGNPVWEETVPCGSEATWEDVCECVFWVPSGTVGRGSSLALRNRVHKETRVEHLLKRTRESCGCHTPAPAPLSDNGVSGKGPERAIPELSRHEGVQGDEVGVGREGLRSEGG